MPLFPEFDSPPEPGKIIALIGFELLDPIAVILTAIFLRPLAFIMAFDVSNNPPANGTAVHSGLFTPVKNGGISIF